ncbi:unnamed protein product [Camellia sinensis]
MHSFSQLEIPMENGSSIIFPPFSDCKPIDFGGQERKAWRSTLSIDDGEGIYEVQEAQSPIATRSMASICPSFFRTTRQRIFDEMIKPHCSFSKKEALFIISHDCEHNNGREGEGAIGGVYKENHVLELLGSQLINHQPNN